MKLNDFRQIKKIGKERRYMALTTFVRPMREAFKRTALSMASIGRQHRILRFIILPLIIVYVFAYNLMLHSLIQFRMKERLARVLAMLLTIIMVLTSIDISAFATDGIRNLSEIENTEMVQELTGDEGVVTESVEDTEASEDIENSQTDNEQNIESDKNNENDQNSENGYGNTDVQDTDDSQETTDIGEDTENQEEADDSDEDEAGEKEIEEEDGKSSENKIRRITSVTLEDVNLYRQYIDVLATEESFVLPTEVIVNYTIEQELPEDATEEESAEFVPYIRGEAPVSVAWTLDSELSTKEAFVPGKIRHGDMYIYTSAFSSELENYEYAEDIAMPEITVIVQDSPDFEQSVTVDGITIRVTAEEGVFPEGVKLEAELAIDEMQKIVDKVAAKGQEFPGNVVGFDIRIVDSAGEEIEPDTRKGKVKVSFSMPKDRGSKASDWDVYHVIGDGEIKQLNTEVDEQDAVLTAETEGFSTYILNMPPTGKVIDMSRANSNIYPSMSGIRLTGDGFGASSTQVNVYNTSGATANIIIYVNDLHVYAHGNNSAINIHTNNKPTNVYIIAYQRDGVTTDTGYQGDFAAYGEYAIRKMQNGACNVYFGCLAEDRDGKEIAKDYMVISFYAAMKGKALDPNINYYVAQRSSLDFAHGSTSWLGLDREELKTFSEAIAFGKKNGNVTMEFRNYWQINVNTGNGEKVWAQVPLGGSAKLPDVDDVYMDGYSLDGWELDGSSHIYQPGEEVKFERNVYFRPVWGEAKNTAIVNLTKDGKAWSGQKLELYWDNKSMFTLDYNEKDGVYSNKKVTNETYQLYLNGHDTGKEFTFESRLSETKTVSLACTGTEITTKLNGTPSTYPGEVTLRKNGQVVYTLESQSGVYNSGFITTEAPLDVYVAGVNTGEQVTAYSANNKLAFNFIKMEVNITDDTPWENAEVTLRKKSDNSFAGQLWSEGKSGNTVTYAGAILENRDDELLLYVDGKDVDVTCNAVDGPIIKNLYFYTARVRTIGVKDYFNIRINNGYQMYHLEKLEGGNADEGYVYEVPHVFMRMEESKNDSESGLEEIEYELTVANTVDTQDNIISSEQKEQTLKFYEVIYINSAEDPMGSGIEKEIELERVYIREDEVLPSYQGNIVRGGYTFNYWSESKWDPAKTDNDCPNIGNPYKVNKNLTLYAVYMSPVVIIGDFINTNDNGTVDGGKGDYVRMGNLAIQGFDPSPQSIKYLYVTTTGISRVKLIGTSTDEMEIYNGATRITASGTLDLTPGRDKIAITYKTPVSMEQAQEFLRKNSILTPDIPASGGETIYTVSVEVMDKNGQYFAANAVGTNEEGSVGTVLTSVTGGKTLYSGIYYVNNNVTFKGNTGQSGLTIASGATVYIVIKPGCTLTCTGGAASGRSTPGGAGIELPSNAKLYLIGNSSTSIVNATGGNAAGGSGGSGGGNCANDKKRYGGAGGRGGDGGAGAGAGIGTRGGTGGTGGAGGAGTGPNEGRSGTSGRNGYAGGNGTSAATAGTVYSTVKINAKGGNAAGGGSGGYSRNKYSHTKSSGVGYCSGDGAGGGGGGGGKAGAAIGSGGGGGAGGGGGGSGATDYSGSNENDTGTNATCRGGAGIGGAPNGSNGGASSRDSGSSGNTWKQTGGAGGGSGSAGANASGKSTSSGSAASFGSYKITFNVSASSSAASTAKKPADISYSTSMSADKTITLPTYNNTNKMVQFLGWDVRVYASNVNGSSSANPFTVQNARYKSGQTVTISKGTYGNVELVAVTETIGGIRKDNTQIGSYRANSPDQKYYTYIVRFEKDDKPYKRGSIYIGDTLVSPNPDYSYTLMTNKAEVKTIRVGGRELATTTPFASGEYTSETTISYSSIQVTVNGIKPSKVKLIDTTGENGPSLSVGQTTGEGTAVTTTYSYECPTADIESIKDHIFMIFADGKDTGITVTYSNPATVNYYTNTIEIIATGFDPSDIKSVELRSDSGRLFPEFVEPILDIGGDTKKAVYKVSRFGDEKNYELYIDNVKITNLSVSDREGVSAVTFADEDKTYTYTKVWYTTTVKTYVNGVLTDMGAVLFGGKEMTRAGKGISVYESGDNSINSLIVNGREVETAVVPGTVNEINYYTITYAASGSEEGVMPVDKRIYLAGDDVTLLRNNEVTYGGRTFTGWTINKTHYDLSEGSRVVKANGPLIAMATWRQTNFNEMNNFEGKDGSKEELPQFVLSLSKEKFTYNGNVQIPEIKVSRNGNGLKAGRDYTILYSNSNMADGRNDSQGGQTNAINAGTVTVTAKGIGDYTGELTASYTIHPKTVYAGGITAENRDYNGSVEVNVNTSNAYLEEVLEEDKDKLSIKASSVCYLPSANAGTYDKLDLQGLGLIGTTASNYILSSLEPISVTIRPKRLETGMFNITETGLIYNGTEQQPAVECKDDGKIKSVQSKLNDQKVGEITVTDAQVSVQNSLLQPSDYNVNYSNNTNAGTATITISADEIPTKRESEDAAPAPVEGADFVPKGNYTGTISLTFPIAKKPITLTAKPAASGYQLDVVNVSDNYIVTSTGTDTEYTLTAADEADLDIRAVTSVKKGYATDVYKDAITIEYNKNNTNFEVTTVSADYTVTKSTVSNTAIATGFTGVYDGKRHSIQVALKNADTTAQTYYAVASESDTGNPFEVEGANIEEIGSTNKNDDKASVKDAGTYTIYYYVTSDNYESTTGSEQVVIAKKPVTVQAKEKTIPYGTRLSGVIGTVDDIATIDNTSWVEEDVKDIANILFRSNGYQVGSPVTADGAAYDLIPVVPTSGSPWKNYDITMQPGSLKVEPKPVKFIWSADELTYNGKMQSVTASIDGVLEQDREYVEPEYSTAGGFANQAIDANAGEDKYTAKVEKLAGLKVTNYQIAKEGASAEHEWHISQAINEWIIAPQIQGWLVDTNKADEFGGVEGAVAVPRFGTATYTYAEITDGIEGTYTTDKPSGVGAYKLKATVKGNDNYTELSSELEFKIVASESNTKPIVKVIPVNKDNVSDPINYEYGTENSNIIIGVDYEFADSSSGIVDKTKINTEHLRIVTDYASSKDNKRGVGTYTLVPDGLTSEHYNLVYEQGVLTITQKTVIATWSATTSFPYNGRLQGVTASIDTAKAYETDDINLVYDFTGDYQNEAVEVKNNYKARILKLSGSDAENYKLSEANRELNWSITKATKESVTFTNGPSLESWYYGDAPKTPVGESNLGPVTFKYQEVKEGISDWLIFNPKDNLVPTNPGTYRLYATVPNGVGGEVEIRKDDAPTFTIYKAEVSVRAEGKTGKYREDLKELTFTEPDVIRGKLEQDEIGAVKEAISKSIATVAANTSPIGSYPITIADAETNKAKITGIGATYTITNAEISFEGGFGAESESFVKPDEITYDGASHTIETAQLDTSKFTAYYSIGTPLGDNNYGTGQTTLPTFKDAGSYTIYYYIAGEGYESLTGSSKVIINKKDITASVANDEIVFNSDVPDYSASPTEPVTLTGLVGDDSIDTIGVTWSYKFGAGTYNEPTWNEYVKGNRAGDYSIVAVPNTNNCKNYNITAVIPGILTVSKASLTTYVGELTGEFAFDALFSLDIPVGGYIYSREEKTPVVKFKSDSDREITESDNDFVVQYANNINAGTAIVTVTAKATGSFEGSLSKTFKIAPRNVTIKVANAESEYNAPIDTITYTEEGENTIIDEDEAELNIQSATTVKKSSKPGFYKDANTVTYNTSNTNYNITVENGDYTVKPADMTVTVSNYSGVYDGKNHTGAVSAKTGSFLSIPKIYYSDEVSLGKDNYERDGKDTIPKYSDTTEDESGKVKTVYYYVVYENNEKIEYYKPQSGSFTVRIDRRPIYLKWTINNEEKQVVVKDGDSAPKIKATLIGTVGGYTVFGDKLEVSINPESISNNEVGSYTLTANVAGDKANNYVKYNSIFNYAIIAAESDSVINEFTKALTCADWNYGDEHVGPIAVTKYGQITYEYYKADGVTMTDLADGAGADGGEPKYPGSYIVKAIVTPKNGDSLIALDPATAFFTINKRPIAIVANNLTSTRGEDLVGLTYTINGGLAYEDELFVALGTTPTLDKDVSDSYKIEVGDVTGARVDYYDITKVNGTYYVSENQFPYTVSAEGYAGVYDGEGHGISVTLKDKKTEQPINNDTSTKIYYSKEELNEDNYGIGKDTTPLVTDAGTTTIYYYIVSSNYAHVKGSMDVMITKRPVTVKANNQEITYGDVPTGGTVTIDGLVGEDTLSGLVNEPTLGYAYTQYGDIGEYAITTNLPKEETENYTFTAQSGTLTVMQRPVTFQWSKSEVEYTGSGRKITASVNPLNLANGDTIGALVGKTVDKDGNTVNEAINVGKYTSEVTALTGDKSFNYIIDEDAKSKDWSIVKAENSIEEYLQIDSWNFGEMPSKPNFKARFGTASFEYTSDNNMYGEYSRTVPALPGIYYVKAKVDGTEMYEELETDPLGFEIKRSDIVIKVHNVFAKAGEKVKDLSSAYTIEGSIASAKKLKVELKIDESANLQAAGSYSINVNISIEGAESIDSVDKYYNVKVVPGKYIVTKSEFNITSAGTTAVYDGKEHGITVEVEAGQNPKASTELDSMTYHIYYKDRPATNEEKAALLIGEEEEVPESLARLPITRVEGGQTDVYFYVVVRVPVPDEDPIIEVVEGMETITVTKAPLKVKAKDKTIHYGEAGNNSGVVYGITDEAGVLTGGFVEGDDERALTGVLSYDYIYKNGEQFYKPGDKVSDELYQIMPKGLSSESYEITYFPGALKVKQGGALAFKVWNQYESKWEEYDDMEIAEEEIEDRGFAPKEITMIRNYEIIDGATMTIPKGYTLFTDGYTLTNSGGNGNRPGIDNQGSIIINAGECGSGAIINKSAMTVEGTIENQGSFTNDTEGNLDVTGTFVNKQGASFTNETGGTAINNGDFIVEEGSPNAALSNRGTFINNEQFINNGNVTTAAGEFVNNNKLNNSGNLQVIDDGSLTNTAHSSLHNKYRGAISLSDSGTITNEQYAETINDGMLHNEGFVHNYGAFENTRSGRFENRKHFCTCNGGVTINNGGIDNNGDESEILGHNHDFDYEKDTEKEEDGRIINNATITGGRVDGKLENEGGGIISRPSVLRGTVINRGEIDLDNDPETDIKWLRLTNEADGRMVTINGDLPKIISQPIDRSVKVGGKVNYNVIARSDSPLTYQWYVYDKEKWGIIDGATEKVLEVENVKEDMDGYTYRCMVSNDNGSVNSALVLLSIIKDSAKGSVTVTFKDGNEPASMVFDTLEEALEEINKREVDNPTIQITGDPVLVPGPKTTLPANAELIVEELAVLIVPSGVTLEVPEDANLTVKPDSRLVIDEGGTLVLKGNAETEIEGQLLNDGEIRIEDDGELINRGTINNGPNGNIDNEGTIDNDGTFHNDGDIINGPEGGINNGPEGTINNDGTVDNNGDITNEGDINNRPNGEINNGPDGTINNDGIIDNDGDITNEGDINNRPSGEINNGPDGTINNDGIIDNDGDITNEGDVNNGPHGDINNKPEGSITNEGDIINGGIIDNQGDIINEKNGEIENGPGGIINNGPKAEPDPEKPGDEPKTPTITNRGIIENKGDLNNDGDIDNKPGTLHNAPSGGIDNNGDISSKEPGGLINDGTLDNQGGTINNDPDADGPTRNSGELFGGTISGPVENEPTGHISADEDDVLKGDFINRGKMDIDEDADINEATVTNEGDGRINFTGTNSNAPVITVQPIDRTVVAGSDVTFSLAVESEEGVTYQWYHAIGNDWISIANGTSRNLIVKNITKSQDGQVFKCIASNKYGSTASDTVSVHLVKESKIEGAFKVKYPAAGELPAKEESFDTLEEALEAAERFHDTENGSGRKVVIDVVKSPVVLCGDITIPVDVKLNIGSDKLVEITSGTLRNDGELVIDNGGIMIIGEECTLENTADIENRPVGRLIINGKLKNEPSNPERKIKNGGIIDVGPKGDIENEGSFDNDGIINNDGHISNNMKGTINNDGIINNDSELENDGKLINDGDINNGPGGDIINHQNGDIVQGGILNNEGEIQNEGIIKNDGEIHNKQDGHIENGFTGSFTNEKNGILDNDGNIDNRGIMENDGFIDNDGDISSHDDGTLTNKCEIDNNGGVINGSKNAKGETINEGEIKGGVINGKFTNEETGVINIPDVLTGEFLNRGLIILDEDSDITKAKITNEGDGMISRPGDLKIKVSSYPADATVKAGDSAIFQVTASADSILFYQWYVNKNDGNGWTIIEAGSDEGNPTAATNRLVIDDTTKDQTGYQYRCLVSSTKSIQKGDPGYEAIYKEQFGEDYENRSNDPKLVAVSTPKGRKTFDEMEAALAYTYDYISNNTIGTNETIDIEVQGSTHTINTALSIPANVSVVIQDEAVLNIESSGSIEIAVNGSLVIRGRANVSGADRITVLEGEESEEEGKEKGNLTIEPRKGGALQVAVGFIATPGAKLTVVETSETKPSSGKIKVVFKDADDSNPVAEFYGSMKEAIEAINSRTAEPKEKSEILIAGTSEFVGEDITIPANTTLTVGKGGYLGIEASITIINNGAINIDDGGIIHIQASADKTQTAKLVNCNKLDVNKGGLLIIDGELDNIAPNGDVKNEGEIDNNGIIENDGNFTNDGEIDNEGTIENDGNFTNDGKINNDGIIDNGGTFTNNGDIDNCGNIDNDGIFDNDGEIDNDGTITNKGNLTNDGEIQNGNGELNNDDSGETNNNGIIKSGKIDGVINNGPIGVIDHPDKITDVINNDGTMLIDDGTDYKESTINGNNPINTDDKNTPVIVTQPDNVTVFENEKVTFKVKATSTKELTYQWFVWNVSTKKWNKLTDNNSAVTSILAIDAVTLADSGKMYRCEVSIVSETPKNPDETPEISTVIASNTATLTVKPAVTDKKYRVVYTDGNLPAKVGEFEYETLEDALKAVENDKTGRPIQITSDNNPIVIDKDVTIQKGTTLVVKAGKEVIIHSPGSITIEGMLDVQHGGKVIIGEGADLTNTDTGTINNDGTVYNKGTFTNNGEMDNSGGTFKGEEDSDATNNGHIAGGIIEGPLKNGKNGYIEYPDRLAGPIDNYGIIRVKKTVDSGEMKLTKRIGSRYIIDADSGNNDAPGDSDNGSDSGDLNDEAGENPVIEAIKDLIETMKEVLIGEEKPSAAKDTQKEVKSEASEDKIDDSIIEEAVVREVLKSDDSDVEKSHRLVTTATVAEEDLLKLAKEVLSDDEMLQLKNGVPVNIWVEIKPITISEKHVQAVLDNMPEGTQVATIFDISVLKQIGEQTAVKVDDVNVSFRVSYEIQDSYRPTDGSEAWYQIMRIYTDASGKIVTEIINIVQDGFKLSFEVDANSKYALICDSIVPLANPLILEKYVDNHHNYYWILILIAMIIILIIYRERKRMTSDSKGI